MYVDNQMQVAKVPRIHAFVYADPGRMKSTFAASFPKPMLVIATDPLDKMAPYRRRGLSGHHKMPDPEDPEEGVYVPTEYVMSLREEGKVAIQIEYYMDRTAFTPNVTSAWEQIQDRMVDLWEEDGKQQWATVVLDSLSSLEYVVRSHYQFKENPITKEGNEQDQRQWYRKSAEGIEQVCYALAWLNCNVVVVAHVRAEKDAVRETVVWTPEAPGVRNRRIPSVFGEIYTIHADNAAEEGVCPFFMQTQSDGKYVVASQIQAPDDCDPKYTAIWSNYKAPARRELTDGGTTTGE